jgi:bud site selection protein 20
MGRYSVKRYKTKRYTRGIDQIFGDDMKDDKSIQNLLNQPIDENKPGLGQYYCIPCSKYFETEVAKTSHAKTKIHKRRVKLIKQGPYTQEEADAAAGLDVAKYLHRLDAQKQKQQVPIIQDLLKNDPTKDQEKNLDMEVEDLE